jgi:hypothetical protein
VWRVLQFQVFKGIECGCRVQRVGDVEDESAEVLGWGHESEAPFVTGRKHR